MGQFLSCVPLISPKMYMHSTRRTRTRERNNDDIYGSDPIQYRESNDSYKIDRVPCETIIIKPKIGIRKEQ